MPAQAGIQCARSLGNPLRTLFRQRANYAQSSDYMRGQPLASPRLKGADGLLFVLVWLTTERLQFVSGPHQAARDSRTTGIPADGAKVILRRTTWTVCPGAGRR